MAAAKRVLTTHSPTPDSLAAVTDAQLGEWFPDRRQAVSTSYHQPDFGWVADKRFRYSKNFTLQQAWRIYLAAQADGLSKYGYTQFCEKFSAYVDAHDLVAVLHHDPGKALSLPAMRC